MNKRLGTLGGKSHERLKISLALNIEKKHGVQPRHGANQDKEHPFSNASHMS